jgi:hypothetical protein
MISGPQCRANEEPDFVCCARHRLKEAPMFDVAPVKRRRFLQTAVLGAAGLTAAEFGRIEIVAAETASASNRSTPSALTALQPIRQVHAGVLDIGYFEAGPSDGQAVLLLHGFPYDIHSYVEVAPMLAAKGYRVIVPHLREAA